MNLEDKAEQILRRLSEVDFTSSEINRTAIEAALKEHLNTLSLSPRPVTFARDSNDAHRRATSSFLESIKETVEAALERQCEGLVERHVQIWREARELARTSAHARQLETARNALNWDSVLLSIPWSRYIPGWTGDRGDRTNPPYIWRSGGDALEYAARAYAELEWAREGPAREGGRSHEEVWLPFVDAFEAGLWIFWIAESEVIALSRPVMKLNGEQVHAAVGPALTWPNSEEQYFFLNDVHVHREIVETPASELDPRLILRENNVGVRREIVRKIGIERICEKLGAKRIDVQGDYELLLLDLQDGRRRPFLKMRNPSIGVYHIEGVAPECHTVAQALAWRNQSDLPPSVLT